MAKRSLIRSAGAALSSVALAAALVPMAAFAEGGAQLTAWTEIDMGDSPAGPSIVQVVTRAISAAAAETEADGILADAESLAEAARAAGAQAAQEAQEKQANKNEDDAIDAPQASEAQEPQDGTEEDAAPDDSSLGTQAIAEDPEDAESETAASDGSSDKASDSAADGSALTAQRSLKEYAEGDDDDADDSSDSAATTTSNIAANSVIWAYNAADATALGDAGAVISNGTIEVISVGSTQASTLVSNASSSTQPYFKAYTSSSSNSTSTDSTTDSSSSSTSTTTSTSSTSAGTLCAPENAEVTVKLMPSRGYQLTTKDINDNITLEPSESQPGYYTFSMPSEGTPFACAFTATSDVVESDSEVVTAGSISNATSAVANGTLKLAIDDISDSTVLKGLSDAAAKLGAKSSDIVGNVDMKLSNAIYQGDPDGTAPWETSLTDLNSAITLTLTLSNDATSGASAFYIVREHNGSYENATAQYNSTDKTITFPCGSFSNFAIVKGTPTSSNNSAPTNNNTSNTSNNSSSSGSTTPTTGDTNDPAPFIALAIVAGAVAAFAVVRIRRKA